MIVMSWFELVQALIHTIPFPMDIVDESGTILFQNDVFKEMFGEDGVGKKCWELYRSDKTQCKDCPLLRPIEIGKTDSYISYDILGEKIYEIHHTGMMFGGKKGVLEIFMDITERKEMTDELRRSEEQFRKLFGNMEQGFAAHEMIYDKEGRPVDYRYIMINEAFEKLTGIKGVDIVGNTIKEVVPSVEDYWIENFGSVAKSGKSGQFEDYFAHANKWFNVTAYSPKKDHFAVIFYDVTEYKEAQQKLVDKEKFISSILDVCPSVIYVYDLIEKKFVFSNKGVEDILGYTKKEIMDINCDVFKELMHPKDYKVYINETVPKYAKIGKRKLSHSYRLKGKNGRYVRLLATEVLYKRDGNGKPQQIIGNIIKE